MARSIKKGPFVDQHLMSKAAAAQATLGDGRSSRPGVVGPPSFPISSV